MTTPLAVTAVTSSSSGTLSASTASEWYRVATNGSGRATRVPLRPPDGGGGAAVDRGVGDETGLAVQQLRGATHATAEGDAERLVTEADPEHRGRRPGAVRDHRHADPRVVRVTGPGRQEDAVDPQR